MKMNKMKHRKWLSIALGTTLVAAGISALAFSCRTEGGKDGTIKKTNPTTPKDVDPKTVVKTGGSKQTTPVTQPKKSTVSLDSDTKLTKKDNKYELKLNITNADNKFVKVELTATSNAPVVATNSNTITSEFGTVKNGKVTVQFSNLDDKMDYKVKSVSLYQTKEDTKPVKVELATKVSDQKIQLEKPKTLAAQPQVQGDDPTAGQSGGSTQGGKQKETKPKPKNQKTKTI
ncbi:hypothetical protein [Ureaplasma diversum]|uniref:Lipoprotein n=1 Tax=Ureaplasma diversum NCTC 246 TaxID=1188241 RepID=A0A084EXK1_9BACT|nr:hypothetical protein [Ureaplasma diversum]KEZ22693.1 Hypothetical protein, predicted lipoprotein [Ureaplasma diversum NCTC 246]